MKFKAILLSIGIIGFLAPAVFAQYTPQSGSAERKAILDSLRAAVKRELEKDMIFEVSDLRVAKGWAVMSGSPRKPDGSPFDYSRTKYESSWRSGDFEDGVQALLRKTGSRRTVVKYSIDATDYWVGGECQKRRCPRGLQ